MPDDVKGHCSGCPNTFKVGDTVFGREVARVNSDSVTVIPLDYMYCGGCARTVLNMTNAEVIGAITELDIHIAENS